MSVVRVQNEAFDSGAELNGFRATVSGAGGVVSFTGVVRDDSGDLEYMEIEHYPAMTQKAIDAIVEQAVERFSLSGSLVIHRFGRLTPGEEIMMVATAARHRVDAFAAAEFLMDYLKSRAPFWKKEVTVRSADWVEARDADEDALKRW